MCPTDRRPHKRQTGPRPPGPRPHKGQTDQTTCPTAAPTGLRPGDGKRPQPWPAPPLIDREEAGRKTRRPHKRQTGVERHPPTAMQHQLACDTATANGPNRGPLSPLIDREEAGWTTRRPNNRQTGAERTPPTAQTGGPTRGRPAPSKQAPTLQATKCACCKALSRVYGGPSTPAAP